MWIGEEIPDARKFSKIDSVANYAHGSSPVSFAAVDAGQERTCRELIGMETVSLRRIQVLHGLLARSIEDPAEPSPALRRAPVWTPLQPELPK